MTIPRVLVIAGSDCSGGAGLEADQKVLAAHGVYAMTATTALTAQNTLGVQDVHVTPPAFVVKQINACLDDIGAHVVKIGMLASAETVDVVADVLEARQSTHELKSIVLDPVMISTSGHQLLPSEAVRNLTEKLVPLSTVVTPNIPEALLLLEQADSHSPSNGDHDDNDETTRREYKHKSPENLEDLKTLAQAVQQRLGPKAVLLKGGHLPLTKDFQKATSEAEKVITVDVLYDGEEHHVVQSPFSRSKNTHGTGCSLASAVASNLALNLPLAEAVKRAVRYVGVGIATSTSLGPSSSSASVSPHKAPTLSNGNTSKRGDGDGLGQGSGPINHFHPLLAQPFSRGYFIEYLLSRADVSTVWHAYTHHEFAVQLGAGTLPVESFKAYLVQDYLYLTHFARTTALAAYKSKTIDQITTSAQIVLHIEREMGLHLEYCRDFGLDKAQIEAHKESLACVAYSRYVLDVGQSEDWLALQMALAPCLLGYGITATRLYEELGGRKEGEREENRYWKWIENYVAEDYRESVRKGRALIEENIVKQSPQRIEELIKIFIRATEMEVQFWDFGAHG